MTSLIFIFVIVLGAILASFVGVIVERIYTGQSYLKGRSKCNSCTEYLGPLDLVPVLSWIVTLGRCRNCGSKVPLQYPVVEISLGSLFALGYIHLGFSLLLMLFLSIILILTFIVLYDMRHTIVPVGASTSLVFLCLVFAYLASRTAHAFGLTLLIAGLVSLGFFCLHYFSKGRAMGLGDAPVAFALSLFAGTQAISGLLFSFWIGALFGVTLLLGRRGGPTMGIEVPFVPFLALGYLLAYFTQWNPLFF